PRRRADLAPLPDRGRGGGLPGRRRQDDGSDASGDRAVTGAASQPVPSRARAALCRQYGPPEDLVVTEVDVPAAGPGQALVRVAVAAVNYPDVLFLQDKYQVSVPPPFVPGSEFSGEVVAVGEGTTGVEVGDRVFGAVMVG